jgi:hypothetical protein
VGESLSVKYMTSTDGVTWTPVVSNLGNSENMVQANGYFFGLGNAGNEWDS